MGDRLWTGKPHRRRKRHPGLLSLSPPSVASWNEYLAIAAEVNSNTLPDDLQDPAVSTSTFRHSLKTHLSLPISMSSALGVCHVMRSINVRYLLTYLLQPSQPNTLVTTSTSDSTLQMTSRGSAHVPPSRISTEACLMSCPMHNPRNRAICSVAHHRRWSGGVC